MTRTPVWIVVLSAGLLACSGRSGRSGDGGGGSGGSPAGGATNTGGSPASVANCDCALGAYIPVCGTDGKTYDATCGMQCVPVEVDCNGECPCDSGGGGGTAGSASGSSCPDEPPPSGSSCDLSSAAVGFAAAQCSWGEDRRPACRVAALCSNGSWSVTQPPAYCSEAEPLPTACPETAQAAAGDCDDPTLSCWYDDGTICRCSPCMGGSEYPICQTIDPPQWACMTPDAACPNPMPQAGESCDQSPELSCGPSCELPIRCRDGAWKYDQVMCPICAAPDTLIATPQGERPISELTPGDLVYSTDATGVVAVPILRVGRTPVVNHRVVRVELSGGKVLEISPGHPTADGRTFGDLLGGGQLDPDHAIVTAEVVPYVHSHTYDILPDSSSGTYFAGGALIGSTLRTR